MRVKFIVLVLATAFSLTGGPAIAAPETGAVNAESMVQTGHGTQLTGPADWQLRREADMVVLTAPEQDAAVAIVAVDAASAAGAIDAAWRRYQPGAARTALLVRREPARNGWDERAAASYAYHAVERRALRALALRHGSKWSVTLLDGAVSTVQKRGAAVDLMFASLRPEGYMDEHFAGRTPARLDSARIERIRSFLQQGMAALNIPGAAFGLLQDGKVIHVEGLGVRQHGRPAKVDADTLFMAASNTKPMTTLLLAALADEGKLRWDQPVTQLSPAFRLGDAATTARVQVKHLVCACTGLPRQDMEMMFEFGHATPTTSLALLAKVAPTSKFGELYQYSNLMAAAAGYIGAHVAYPGLEAGAAYDRAMREKIFAPLGMHRTTFNMQAALRGNHASPHTLDHTYQVRAHGTEMDASINPHRPVGGAWTSARDFIRYVQLEANEGTLPNGKRLISRANLLARRVPQVTAGAGVSYGMGLETLTIAGVPVLNHGGSLPGYKSNFYLLPEAGVGAVLLTNADDGQALLSAFKRFLLEVVYDGKPEAEEDLQFTVAAIDAWKARPSQLTVPPAPEVVQRLAARYRNAALGDLIVTHQDQQTYLDAGEWKTAVATRKNQDGSVSLQTITPGLDNFNFVIDHTAGAKALILDVGQQKYVFRALGTL